MSAPFDPAPFRARRARVLKHMQQNGGGVALIATAPERMRNRETAYPYRFDSYFHYLTGFAEPQATLVLIADANPRSILFCREKNVERETWEGFHYGPEAAAAQFAFDEAHACTELAERLPALIAGGQPLWCAFGHEDEATAFDALHAALIAVRHNARAGWCAPATLHDIRHLLDEMRLIKDETERTLMRRAGVIARDAHIRAMRATRPGRYEYEIEAELLHAFRAAGATGPAYTNIVASGANACTLHYTANDRQMHAGELLLIDAGCELEGYASDITRTFPVSGRFSAAQRAIYELVLAMQHAAARATRPGVSFDAPHDAAVDTLIDGLRALKLLTGSREEIVETKSWQRFYMHRTGHWLGRDVHDVGQYRPHDAPRTLAVGMTLTIEPGCYIRAAADIDPAFHDIGIRIEDDALVTADGCQLYTADTPKTVAEIETLMQSAQATS